MQLGEEIANLVHLGRPDARSGARRLGRRDDIAKLAPRRRRPVLRLLNGAGTAVPAPAQPSLGLSSSSPPVLCAP